jgi:hypothetical protein
LVGLYLPFLLYCDFYYIITHLSQELITLCTFYDAYCLSQKSEYTWKGRNGRIKFETLIMAIMDRRLRFGDVNPTKIDMWFNELFETGELIWIEQKNKAQEEVEAEIWGVFTDQDVSSPSSLSSNASPSSRLLSERSERRLKPLLECFERITTFTGVSDKIVLSNLQFLLIDKRALPDAVFSEENVRTLLGLVRIYLEGIPSKASPSPTPNLADSSSTQENITILGPNSKYANNSKERVRDGIVECVLKLFSRWCKASSSRWNRPTSAYLSKPMPADLLFDEVHEMGSSDSPSHSRSVLVLKHHVMTLLNDYILKILQSAPSNLTLTTKCFVQLAYSTIVLRSPEKEIPTQVFIHYMQYGPLNTLNRTLYWEMIDAVATLMRHLTSLDQFLELSSILMNGWNTIGSPFDTRPPFGVPLPPEAQHLPPVALFNHPTQLVVSSSHPSHAPSMSSLSSSSSSSSSSLPSFDQSSKPNSGDMNQPTSQTTKLDPAPEQQQQTQHHQQQSLFRGETRKRLPPLQHQRDIFSLFRIVSLWRRFDQGWSEAADDEIQALALTIQYCFVNGPPPAQTMALMAAMGVLDSLVQSKSLSSTYTITVFNNILTHATMRVALNDAEIRSDWRSWRQSVAMIVSSFDQSFPNIDDTLLLQIVTDVLLEDAMNVDYLFQSDPKPENMAEMMKRIESQKSSYLFRLIPLITRSLASLFNHTKNTALHDATMYKLHSYAVQLHHLWRLYQPKYRAMNSTLQQKQQQQQQNQKMAVFDHGGGIEKAAKLVLDKFFAAFVFIFDAILPSLSYKQITRAIEALGFLEFSSSRETEEGPYAELIEKLVDKFHSVRPNDNWIVSFLNLGIASIFGSSAKTTKENSLKLDKPSLIRIKQYFTVVQHTCAKYPYMLTRPIMEHRGLLSLLFWMLQNPYKAINRKAHQTFSYFFLQPHLLENEPYVGEKMHIQVSPTSANSVTLPVSQPPSPSSSSPNLPSSPTDPSNKYPSLDQKKKQKTKKRKTSFGSATSGTVVPGAIQYTPKSFSEEILPYYWRLTLDNYPEKTRSESILLNLSILLGGALPADSPLIPFVMESLMEKLSSLRLSKSASELTRIAMGLIGIIPLSTLPLFLHLLQEYVSQCPKRLQRFLCANLLESISKNLDYTRKEMCTNWYMNLIETLGFHSKL